MVRSTKERFTRTKINNRMKPISGIEKYIVGCDTPDEVNDFIDKIEKNYFANHQIREIAKIAVERLIFITTGG